MSTTHLPWSVMIIAVPLAIVVMSVFVITLAMAFFGSRRRAIASILVMVGLLAFFLSATSVYVAIARSRPARINVDRQLARAEWLPVRELAVQRAIAEQPLQLAELDETPSPLKPAGDDEKPKAKSPEAATDAASAPDETSGAEKAKSEETTPDDGRPDWVDAPKPFKDGGVYKVPVTVGPWPTSKESMELLPAAADAEIAKYAVARVGKRLAAKVRLPRDYVMNHMIQEDVWEEALKIDSFDDVKHMVGRDVWENSDNAADGKWTRLHVLLKFDRDVNQRLDDGWARVLRIERLQAAGALGVIAMIILGAVYSYLKIDLKTGGVYRGRLRAGALAAILALIVLMLLNTA